MIDFRASTDQDLPRVMEIWRRAVDATHAFLDPSDRMTIEADLPDLFAQVSLQLALDVNEQNPHALGFYEHMGFERIGRSAFDGQGSLSPLIHLRHRLDL